MAKILCLTSDVAGMLYPGVELAHRLAADGHRLTYASFATARSAVDARGLDFLELEPSRYEAFLAADGRRGLWQRLRRLSSRRREAVASLSVESLAPAVQRLDPDLILIDGEMHEHVLAASAAGVPRVLLNCFVSIWRRPGLPPPHHLARPGAGWKGSRLGMRILWRALRFRKLWRAWSQKVRRIGCDRLSLLRRLARETGFDLRRETDAGQWLMPFTYRRLPVLSLHALEFEFSHRPPQRVRYVGPMVPAARDDDRVTEAVRGRLDAIYGRGRTLIYAGFGSYFTASRGLLCRLAEAVGERRDWELVISLGGRADPADLDPLPENVHAFGWLPQLEVLRHAAVAVTHGGINTLDECVLHGVPVLVYCGFETDMAGNTSRVVHHGLGIAGDPEDDPGAIREHLERLLEEPGFRGNVERMRAAYAAYAEDRVAERAVRSLLEGRPLLDGRSMER